MPTVARFLTRLAIFAAVVYGAMVALVALVEPNQVEMTVDIPRERMLPPAQPAPSAAAPAEAAD